jgi:hypothetical protein
MPARLGGGVGGCESREYCCPGSRWGWLSSWAAGHRRWTGPPGVQAVAEQGFVYQLFQKERGITTMLLEYPGTTEDQRYCCCAVKGGTRSLYDQYWQRAAISA